MNKIIGSINRLLFGEEPIHFYPPQGMRDSAITHRGKRYVTHSTLHHSESAVKTFTAIHLLFLLSLFGAAYLILYFLGLITLAIVVVSLLTSLYFADLLFNLFLVFRSFSKSSELAVTKDELSTYANYDWPSYTIFCPLYKEVSVLPQFVDSIKKLDYPKDKLEVMLLLEEDDKNTIQVAESMGLPNYIKVIVVPHSFPKTKPKAVNYGLSMATGKYAVIYDAEDMPEADQLKKAVIAFSKVDDETICLQAKLNFYNARQNILTRLFTAEYSLWFDLILTGLQSINAPIPLGGTSNHFKVDRLNELKGWDPFNVTEDCDLGIRIWRKGYKTAIVDSTTWEEANSRTGNWLRQRSRWIKGYIQTFLVHYKKPVSLFRENLNWHIFSFNLIVLGKVISVFVNPFMWAVTVLYFVARSQLGASIEQLFPSVIFYIAVVSLAFGNFLYVYYMVLGLAKRSYWDLILFFPLVPIYWLMMSVAAWRALYQLVVKPHYWEKTTHGLHLGKNIAFNYNFDVKKTN